jgi:hypothetical protein
MSAPALRCGVLLVLALLLGLSAGAAERSVTLAPGESLEQLAERLYGDPGRAAALRAHNKLPGGPLQPGATLDAPFSETVRVAPGDSWSSLAKRHWGDGRRGRDLALVVRGDSAAKLRAGSSIQVPVFVEERLEKGKTLAALSRRHYGTSSRADLLTRVNGIKNARRLRVGAKIRVPVVLIEASPQVARAPEPPAPPQPDVAAPSPAPAPTPAPADGDFEALLYEAVGAYLDGSYGRALEELETLRPGVLESGQRGERELLLTNLVYLYVAFDRPDQACETFGELRTLDPQVQFDEDLVSPKIRRLVERCPN